LSIGSEDVYISETIFLSTSSQGLLKTCAPKNWCPEGI
jgi:hypothetical protein